MNYNYTLFLVGVIIIAISLGVILNTNSKIEKYTDQNIRSFSHCGRNIAFANFTSTNLASQRAMSGLEYTNGISRGNCILPGSKQTSEDYETYSIIKDNYIYYALKRGCLGLKYNSIETNNQTATILFENRKQLFD